MSCNRLMTCLAAACALCPTLAPAQDRPQWQLVSTTGPGPQNGHAMAYDSLRGVAVLFGGSPFGGSPLAETWEWDGENWQQRASSGPSARAGHAMTFDSRRGVTVLFGGSLSQDTWEWNGSEWQLCSTSGPSARRWGAMAYDAARGVAVFFGGQCIDCGDTWEWDGDNWVRRSITGPHRRSRHAMAYDSDRQVTVLFGGSPGSGETWEWDGHVWILRDTLGLGNRLGHAMAYDATEKAGLSFGGITAQPEWYNQTWAWDGTSWSVRSDFVPEGRLEFAMVFDSRRNVTVLFGGASTQQDAFLGDTWELPSCVVDSDGDGVPDEDDACDESDLRDTVFIGDCDSGVGNQLFEDGCTIADLIAQCDAPSRNHGEFASCVADLANEWMRDDLITSADRGATQRCAARAEAPASKSGPARQGKPTSPLAAESLHEP